MPDDERRTMQGIAARLSAPDERLTLEEARTLAAIASTDRLTECLTVLRDMQLRLFRLESYVETIAPGYRAATIRAAAAIAGRAEEQA
jgi:hypothetical protein